MPELPEVETVCRGLNEIIPAGKHKISKIETGAKSLRTPFRKAALRKGQGQKIKGILRKAKYLLFELDDSYLLSHLGMTGSWRIESNKDKHDHVRIHLEDGRTLTYRDPRRFGQFDILAKETLSRDKRFVHLGPDPVVGNEFNSDYLYSICKKRNIAIKTLIMNQEIVVGVGNIYASEALYLAGIHPEVKASELSLKECNLLVESIKETLWEAIFCGGSTISDFKQAGGSEGYFQNYFFVYGRDKELCRFCESVILSKIITGRNSYWCSSCQKSQRGSKKTTK
jgi:formamidopyrimidine-DNA glycosylase